MKNKYFLLFISILLCSIILVGCQKEKHGVPIVISNLIEENIDSIEYVYEYNYQGENIYCFCQSEELMEKATFYRGLVFNSQGYKLCMIVSSTGISPNEQWIMNNGDLFNNYASYIRTIWSQSEGWLN